MYRAIAITNAKREMRLEFVISRMRHLYNAIRSELYMRGLRTETTLRTRTSHCRIAETASVTLESRESTCGTTRRSHRSDKLNCVDHLKLSRYPISRVVAKSLELNAAFDMYFNLDVSDADATDDFIKYGAALCTLV